jgi:hypothetical protein
MIVRSGRGWAARFWQGKRRDVELLLGEVGFREALIVPQWRDGTTYSGEPNFNQRCSLIVFTSDA